MATVDHTGLIPVSVQRIVTAVEEEISKLVLFKDYFEDLADDLKSWKPLFLSFDNVFREDAALNSWVNNCNEWMQQTESLIRDCQAVAAGRSWSPDNINKKRELREAINIVTENLRKLILQVPVLVLHQLSRFNNSQVRPSYLKQVIPDQLLPIMPSFLQIMEKLISPPGSSIKWVGIWGQGGSGKTITAKRVNNSVHVVNWFNGNVFFLVIGGAASKKDVLQRLCRLVGCKSDDRDDEHTIQSVLHTALQGKRALLILDDVWDASFLDLLDVVDGQEGSKIFVTTRNRELLLQRLAKDFYAALMDDADSRRLFYNHAFGVGKDCLNESIRKCADEMARLCKGLPLALAIVGSAISKKPQRYWAHEARRIREKCLLPECSGVFQYGYEQLEPLEQECFLTMLSFPEDYNIQYVKDLVAWWRGEGLIGPLHEGGWEDGEIILESLKSRSLIQSDDSDGYRIHDVILELGLDHLLKDELKSHEEGHLFMSSPKHREMFLKDVGSNPAKLRKIRKIAYQGGSGGSYETWKSCKEALQVAASDHEFRSLETFIWDENCKPSRWQWDVDFGEAFSKVVCTNDILKVVMLDWSGDLLGLRSVRGIINFEFRSALVQTLTIMPGKDAITIGGGVSGVNLRCLRLWGASFLQRQTLHNLEIFENHEVLNIQLSQVNLKNLVILKLEAWVGGDTFMLQGMDMSNIRHLSVSGKEIELQWPSGTSLPEACPKLETVTACGVQDIGDWYRLFSGGRSELTHLKLSGWLGAMDHSMQSMTSGRICLPALISLDLENKDEGPPEFPAIVTDSDLQMIESLDLTGFRVSEDHARSLHRFQQLKRLNLRFRGPVPRSLIGHPNAFLHLEKLDLAGNFDKEFPLLGKGALPQLRKFSLDQHDDANVKRETMVVQIGATGSDQAQKLEVLRVSGAIQFRLIPAELVLSPSLKKLTFFNADGLEKLELEPEVELRIIGSSLESLEIYWCKKMTFDKGIPEVFKKMQQNGKLNITYEHSGYEAEAEGESEPMSESEAEDLCDPMIESEAEDHC